MRLRYVVALFAALLSGLGYCTSRSRNPVTGEVQYVAMSPEEELKLGNATAPKVAAEFGGPSPDREAQAAVDSIGRRLVERTLADEVPYEFSFTVLDDDRTVNAFALPGGPIFITEALLARLDTRAEVAGVLAHEIAHVIERHAAEQIAKQQLAQGLTGAAAVAAYDPENPSSRGAAMMAQMAGQLISLKYGRGAELESDRLGVRLMAEAGYDPRGMIATMQVLQESGGQGPPEFLSTHPNPANRIPKIEEAIAELYPDGVPAGLER